MYFSAKFPLFYIISSVTIIVISEGKFYPEYEEYYEGMDKNQQRAFKLYIRSWRKHRDKMAHFPKDKLATMDEYLDTSGRGTMIDDVLYDVLKEKYDRDKAVQKYSHPDDQEVYMAVRKCTPTLGSSEISNWVHNVNSRYRNILGINETITTAGIKELPTTTKVGRSTKFSTRITIFPKGYNPFASIESDCSTYEHTTKNRFRGRYPKHKYEPIEHDVEKLNKDIFTTPVSCNTFGHNAKSEEENDHTELMMERLVKNYFKSQSLQYKDSYTNVQGFRTCPTASPLSQEKLIKEFNEMMKVPDLRLEAIFRAYENRSIYNDSYIEEYLRYMNFSTMWVSDFPKLNITLAASFSADSTIILEQVTTTSNDLHTRKVSSLEYDTTSDGTLQREDTLPKRSSPISENLYDLEENMKNIENSILSLMKSHNHETTSFKAIIHNAENEDEKILEPQDFANDQPTYFEENMKDEFFEKENKEKEKTGTNGYYYNQNKIFEQNFFRNQDDSIPHIVDRIHDSIEGKDSFHLNQRTVTELSTINFIEREKDFVGQNSDVFPKKLDNSDDFTNQCETVANIQEKLSVRLETPTLKSQSFSDGNMRGGEAKYITARACDKCNHTYSRYQRKSYRRRRKNHHHHRFNKKRQRYGYNKHHYPPNPYAYNPFYPPPPPPPPPVYPYPPHFYPPPPPPPNFYHFTSEYSGDKKPDSLFTPITDNQFDLYMKLKNIFQPVDNVLKDLTKPLPPGSSMKEYTDDLKAINTKSQNLDAYSQPFTSLHRRYHRRRERHYHSHHHRRDKIYKGRYQGEDSESPLPPISNSDNSI